MSAHTPGPWKLWTGCSWRRFGSEATNQTVCEPTNHPGDGWPDLHFPNGGTDGPDARLIAAAPELLEACNNIILAVETPGFSVFDAVDSVRAAIAKAEGR